MEDTTTVTDLGLTDAHWQRLSTWMRSSGLGDGPITEVRPLGGGTQNVVARFQRCGRSYVLRKGPVHLRPVSNDVMRREMRVLSALADTPVRVPRVLATCPDGEPFDGAAFYLMEPVYGFSSSDPLPPELSSPAARASLVLDAVDQVVVLHAVDHEAVGLGDFGRPDGYLERQVPRWSAELDRYRAFEGWPGPQLPGLDAVSRWLEAKRPTGFRAGITHGDYHLSNLLYTPTPAVAAIVDWEMCTIGDPLVDLGWLLATLPTETGGDTLATAGDLPAPETIIERYASQSDRDVEAVRWYEVLACFRLGIIVEGTYARSFAGLATAEMGEQLHARAIELFEHALERLG
jgi:aminoglycoside phosphotransferase (APT) family kinase protein